MRALERATVRASERAAELVMTARGAARESEQVLAQLRLAIGILVRVVGAVVSDVAELASPDVALRARSVPRTVTDLAPLWGLKRRLGVLQLELFAAELAVHERRAAVSPPVHELELERASSAVAALRGLMQ